MVKTARGLEKKGHFVHILAHPNGRFAKSNPDGVRMIKKKLGMDYNPFMIYYLSGFIKRNRIDLVVTNIEKEVIIGGLAARICNVPNIKRVGREDDFNKKLKVKWHHQLFVNECITPCDYVRDQSLMRAPYLDPEQFTTIYNGKNPVQFSRDRITWQKKEWGLLPDDFVLGVTSQITRVKGIDQVIEVFRKILEKNPDLHLVITGEGKEKERLIRLAGNVDQNNRIIFSGFSNHPMLAAAAYDIAISNSWFEGFPNTVVEYLAAGCPVVTTDAGGVNEMVVHGENALLIPCFNPDQLYEKLMRLIEHQDLREKLKRNARITIQEKFSEDGMIETLESYFLNVHEKWKK